MLVSTSTSLTCEICFSIPTDKGPLTNLKKLHMNSSNIAMFRASRIYIQRLKDVNVFILYIFLPCQAKNPLYLNQSGAINPNQFRNGEIFQISPKRLRNVFLVSKKRSDQPTPPRVMTYSPTFFRKGNVFKIIDSHSVASSLNRCRSRELERKIGL
jgi:hypothetical protein